MKSTWRDGTLKIKIDVNKLHNFYKIYCAKTTNTKNRLFKDFDEFAYMVSRKGMEKIMRDFNRRTCNVSKIHNTAEALLAFGEVDDFMPIDEDAIIPSCSTLEASLRLMRNKNVEDILRL